MSRLRRAEAADVDALVTSALRRADAEGLVDVAWALEDTPIGPLTLAATPAGVVRIGFGHDSTQHLDEQARQRQIRPGGVSRHMEQHDETLPAPLGGDERRPVSETRPGLLGKPSLRLGEHLTRHCHFIRRGKAKERADGFEGRNVLRALPGQCAAEQASAAAKRGRLPGRELLLAIPRFLRLRHDPEREGLLATALGYLSRSPAALAAQVATA